MKINRYNCEAKFLDYYEGSLSPVEVGEMLLFLEENPDLKTIFESYEEISLQQEKIYFPEKESLKKKYNKEELEIILSSEITKENCEQFFIASAEGILSSKQIEKLNLFLAQNPESQKDFQLFQLCKLSDEKIPFEQKDVLKKPFIIKENCEEYFIRSVENDLNRVEEEQLKLFLQKNPEFKKEIELFSATILPADKISFEEKASLKKGERRTVFISFYSQRTLYYAAAAAILFLIGLFFFFRNDQTDKTYFAGKINPDNKIQKENIFNVNNSQKNTEQRKAQSKEKLENQNPVQNKIQSKNQKPHDNSFAKKNSISPKEKIKEEKLQPIILEDNSEENLFAQTEQPKPEMMKEEEFALLNSATAQKKVEKKKNDSEEYQAFSAFANKKVKSLLGIKNTSPCDSDDKLRVWDLAIAAKNGIQKYFGTNSIDAQKSCDGTGNKVEYVFTAGNFSISKNTAKKTE